MRLVVAFIIPVFVCCVEAGSIRGEIKVIYPENIHFLMEKFKTGFEKTNSQVRIILQDGSSPEQVRKISRGQEFGDIIIVSDDQLARPQLQSMYESKPVDFMSDEIALIAGKNAKYFDELQPRTWHEYLLRSDVKVATPDLAVSYAGFRSPLVWKLAETWVHNMSVYENFTAKLGSALPPQSIISALQSGDLDYAFDYATQAKQKGLRMFRLLKYYNLGDPSLAHVYKSAVIEIPGEKEGEKKLLYGEPIIYSIGRLKGSRNETAAQAFMDYVTSTAGRAILEQEKLTPM